MVSKVRIRRLTRLLSQRWFRFKAGSKWAKLLVEQLWDLCGEFDDECDAFEVGVRLASDALDFLEADTWRPPPLPVYLRSR
jgi:hypothetical protein